MNRSIINNNWKFYYGDQPSAFQKDFDDAAWESVTVPHDWSVTLPFDRTCSSGTGYLPDLWVPSLSAKMRVEDMIQYYGLTELFAP